MSFREAVESVLSHYATFSGRARRSEYWWWSLALLGGYAVIALLGALVLVHIAAVLPALLLVVFALGVLVPNLAVLVRRLHDTGRSAWFLLVTLIPFVGGFVLLFVTVQEGTPNSNKYGPSPKGAGAFVGSDVGAAYPPGFPGGDGLGN